MRIWHTEMPRPPSHFLPQGDQAGHDAGHRFFPGLRHRVFVGVDVGYTYFRLSRSAFKWAYCSVAIQAFAASIEAKTGCFS